VTEAVPPTAVVPGRGFARETDERPPFRFAAHTRVGFDETDAQGVVYYGRYLPYFDRARVEYLRHLGLLHRGPAFVEFVMRASAVEYHAPAVFDDLLDVFLRASRIGRTSVTYEYAAFRDDGVLLCTATQTLVAIEAATRRKVPVDAAIRTAIATYERLEEPR
jgi:acyl-CoA thioester hydrolase